MTDKHYYLIFNEREALREQNDRLRAQLVAAGKACEEAATALIARDAQLMAKDAEIASLKSANEDMDRRLRLKDEEIERHKTENRRLAFKVIFGDNSAANNAEIASPKMNKNAREEIDQLRDDLEVIKTAAGAALIGSRTRYP